MYDEHDLRSHQKEIELSTESVKEPLIWPAMSPHAMNSKDFP